jgi:hypothetical protein
VARFGHWHWLSDYVCPYVLTSNLARTPHSLARIWISDVPPIRMRQHMSIYIHTELVDGRVEKTGSGAMMSRAQAASSKNKTQPPIL